ncbi:MAG: LacI family DNA-binding transcriptional regulator [Verrucomicrobia bacterium]|nr:LacI family DNA-binding transcriptional regulator [Verrucomicrobiota bacterium]
MATQKLNSASAPTRKYPSSTEVAKLAGVSQSAVSRTFTAGASVSERTRKKVIKAAEALGYSPNILPRILLTNRSRLVAIVIGEMSNPYYARVLEEFSRVLQEQGNQVLLCSVGHGEYVDDAIPSLAGYRVDGIITAHPILSEEAAEQCEKIGVPIVLFNGRVRSNWVSSICCDNSAAGRDVADLFLKYGAKRFGYIAGGQETLANQDRSAGFINRLKESGISDIRSVSGNFRYEDGYQAALKLMEPKRPPQAIFCANDMMAFGAIDALRHEAGVRVPQEVMVAGFDDIPEAGWASYSLTTVRQEVGQMVQAAVPIFQTKAAGHENVRGLLKLVRGTLVQRGSTTGWIKRR